MPLGQKLGFSISLCRVNFAECPAPHGPGFVTVLVTKVTAATCVKTLPSTAAPVCSVIDADARIFPRKSVPPTVAELPTCQKTLDALAPFIRITWRPLPTVSVEAGIWKIQTPLELPRASSVRSPELIVNEPGAGAVYRPGAKVSPPSSPL